MEVLCPKWSHDAASGVLVISGVKMADMKRFARKCNHCGKLFNEGYCIEGGEEYYCSKQCLNTQYTDQEFEELYDLQNDSIEKNNLVFDKQHSEIRAKLSKICDRLIQKAS